MVAAPLSTRSHVSTVSVTGPATVVAYCTIPAFPWRPGNTLKTHKSEFPEGLILQGTALWAQGRAPEALLSRLPALCPAHADTMLLFSLSPGQPTSFLTAEQFLFLLQPDLAPHPAPVHG